MSEEKTYIYVTGGRLRGKTLGCVERFSFEKDEWQTQPRMQESRGSHGAVALGAALIVVGGGGFKSNLSTVEMLLCENNSNDNNDSSNETSPSYSRWTNIAPLTTHRHALGVQLFREDSVFAIGGWINGSECSGAVEKYDLKLNAWSHCSPLFSPRRLHGTAALHNSSEIFVFGGNREDGDWYTASVESYDVAGDCWRECNDLPLAGPCSAATVRCPRSNDEKIFVFMHGNAVYRYNHIEDSYEKLSALPLPEWFCFDVVAIDLDIYAVGGAQKGKWSNAFYRYKTESDVWEELPRMRKERRRCAAAVVRIPDTLFPLAV